MQVRIETSQIDLPHEKRHSIERASARVLARFSRHIRKLHLSVKDVNGRKGGRDKVCTLRLTLEKGGEVLVIDRSRSLARAILRGLRRSRALLKKHIARQRRYNRGDLVYAA